MYCRRYGVYLGSRSILAIHNLKHQVGGCAGDSNLNIVVAACSLEGLRHVAVMHVASVCVLPVQRDEDAAAPAVNHQGVFSPSTYGLLDLPPDWYKCLEWQYPPHERQVGAQALLDMMAVVCR
jgi:hypothetical protein